MLRPFWPPVFNSIGYGLSCFHFYANAESDTWQPISSPICRWRSITFRHAKISWSSRFVPHIAWYANKYAWRGGCEVGGRNSAWTAPGNTRRIGWSRTTWSKVSTLRFPYSCRHNVSHLFTKINERPIFTGTPVDNSRIGVCIESKWPGVTDYF